MTDGRTEHDEGAAPTGLTALTGLRVIEMGVWVAAPSAGALLADWGADVIKVEPPNGDPMRSAFGSLGIGKDFPIRPSRRTTGQAADVVLDLRRPEAKEQLDQLALDGGRLPHQSSAPTRSDGLGLEPGATVGRVTLASSTAA